MEDSSPPILQLEEGDAALILSPSSIQVFLGSEPEGDVDDHVLLVWALAKLLSEDDRFQNDVIDRLSEIENQEEA